MWCSGCCCSHALSTEESFHASASCHLTFTSPSKPANTVDFPLPTCPTIATSCPGPACSEARDTAGWLSPCSHCALKTENPSNLKSICVKDIDNQHKTGSAQQPLLVGVLTRAAGSRHWQAPAVSHRAGISQTVARRRLTIGRSRGLLISVADSSRAMCRSASRSWGHTSSKQ